MRRLNVRNAIKKNLKDCFQLSSRMANLKQHPHSPLLLLADAPAVQGDPVQLADIEVNMDFINNNIIITGGSSGIGLALAKELSSLGANITILARHKDLLDSALSEIKKSAISQEQQFKWISADVSNFDELERELSKDNNAYDILINSAGLAFPGEFVEMGPEIFKNLMDVNYLGTVYMSKLVVPKMIVRKTGYIVNLSSYVALVGYYGYTAYAPTKYAVRGFSRCLRSELKPYGIDVSVVIPQDTDTPQLAFERSHLPLVTQKTNKLLEKIFGSNSLISADKAANYIIYGMKKRKFSIYFGTVGVLTSLITPLIGRLLYHYTVNIAKKDL